MKGKTHPENFCQQCGSKNPTWSAENKVWNTYCEEWEIICPHCFQERAWKEGVNVHIHAQIRAELDNADENKDKYAMDFARHVLKHPNMFNNGASMKQVLSMYKIENKI